MPRIAKSCNQCFKEFMPSSRHRECPSCRRLAKRVPCPNCALLKEFKSSLCKQCNSSRLEANGNWRGGITTHKKGYIQIKVAGWPKNNGYKFEHILVMEAKLGRLLLPGENVHHINGVRDDNRVENLELWIRPQPTGIRVDDAVAYAKEILRRYDN
jgi:hypothetical protein